ncbi:5233_t:CDS:1, partial [Dentiscutata erythropus]
SPNMSKFGNRIERSKERSIQPATMLGNKFRHIVLGHQFLL